MSLVDQLVARGVRIPAPASVVIDDVDPARFERDVVIWPGTTVCGQRSAYGAGTQIGRAGGGYFRDVVAGRGCDLYGGVFEDCALMDGVVVRGHAEFRQGTLLEEGCEAAHHVGYKMTIMMPFTVAGSLVNFCDAVFAGGTGRDDHGEIGSCMALYNYTPWGDKFASMFGNVSDGVFLRKPRVFVGGQTQIVSPVTVGFGTVVVAGSGLRRNVGENRLVGEVFGGIDEEFEKDMLGATLPKLVTSLEIIGNLRALEIWYLEVRRPFVDHDVFARWLVDHGLRQVRAAIGERIKRVRAFVAHIERSEQAHVAAAKAADSDERRSRHLRRAADHAEALRLWAAVGEQTGVEPDGELRARLRAAVVLERGLSYVNAVQSLDDEAVDRGSAILREIVDLYCGR